MVAAIVVFHGLDMLTFWAALAVYGVPIQAESNPLMVGSYVTGGFLLVAATKLTLVAAMVALLAKVRTRNLLPAFLGVCLFGLIGAAANIHAISEALRWS